MGALVAAVRSNDGDARLCERFIRTGGLRGGAEAQDAIVVNAELRKSDPLEIEIKADAGKRGGSVIKVWSEQLRSPGAHIRQRGIGRSHKNIVAGNFRRERR